MPFGKGQSGNPAGRPPKAEKFARPIARAEKKIADRLPHLADKLLELADGVTVQAETRDGPVIYDRAPDFKALEYLCNRILGKPTERTQTELSGLGGSPIAFSTRYEDLSDDELDARIAALEARAALAGGVARGEGAPPPGPATPGDSSGDSNASAAA